MTLKKFILIFGIFNLISLLSGCGGGGGLKYAQTSGTSTSSGSVTSGTSGTTISPTTLTGSATTGTVIGTTTTTTTTTAAALSGVLMTGVSYTSLNQQTSALPVDVGNLNASNAWILGNAMASRLGRKTYTDAICNISARSAANASGEVSCFRNAKTYEELLQTVAAKAGIALPSTTSYGITDFTLFGAVTKYCQLDGFAAGIVNEYNAAAKKIQFACVPSAGVTVFNGLTTYQIINLLYMNAEPLVAIESAFVSNTNPTIPLYANMALASYCKPKGLKASGIVNIRTVGGELVFDGICATAP